MLEAHAVLWQGSVDLEQKLLMTQSPKSSANSLKEAIATRVEAIASRSSRMEAIAIFWRPSLKEEPLCRNPKGKMQTSREESQAEKERRIHTRIQ